MQKVKQAIENALESIEVPETQIKAFRELMYSASETSIVGFSFHGDDSELETFIQLVALSKKCKNKVPEKFRL